jgi:hypothetical protein
VLKSGFVRPSRCGAGRLDRGEKPVSSGRAIAAWFWQMSGAEYNAAPHRVKADSAAIRQLFLHQVALRLEMTLSL